MTRTELQTASEELRQAASQVEDDEIEERLYDQSNQLAELATAERGPDHGRLARHTQALSDIAETSEDSVASHIEAALSQVRAYRETVSGV